MGNRRRELLILRKIALRQRSKIKDHSQAIPATAAAPSLPNFHRCNGTTTGELVARPETAGTPRFLMHSVHPSPGVQVHEGAMVARMACLNQEDTTEILLSILYISSTQTADSAAVSGRPAGGQPRTREEFPAGRYPFPTVPVEGVFTGLLSGVARWRAPPLCAAFGAVVLPGRAGGYDYRIRLRVPWVSQGIPEPYLGAPQEGEPRVAWVKSGNGEAREGGKGRWLRE
uniref:Uncharacterized protein n=1 Tax=Pristionchus pacificus TaxID=54126 RepID=A0A2A6C7Y3_PRIPA|eukprot:PDM74322.1 hypothetical protein PRIPAC_41678 [Pristionchus pacificus]